MIELKGQPSSYHQWFSRYVILAKLTPLLAKVAILAISVTLMDKHYMERL